ncbi:MAG: polyphosphate kinase 1 [Bacteroidia bacterium]|jgi:polyphosphate kinase|nr:polyphosphate kinase 1 [Bacteroidia bacterium]
MLRKKLPFINRDISWLSFNERVLQEAEDDANPLIERLRFLGIYSNNRDEFFRVRVATLKRMGKLGRKAESVLGAPPDMLLSQIQKRVVAASHRFDRIYNKILAELEKHHIHIIDETELTKAQGEFVTNFFRNKVMPSLFPIMLDNAPQFPYLRDRSTYLVVRMIAAGLEAKPKYALIEVPADAISRFVVLPQGGIEQYVMLLDDVIRFCLSEVFPGYDPKRISAYTIKLTRDAELDLDTDVSKSFLEKMSGGLKKRKKGIPVRFVYDKQMPADMLKFLLRQLKVIRTDNIIPGSRYHNFKDFIRFPDLGHPELIWPVHEPLRHPRLIRGESMFDVIREKDLILHYPYQTFDHVIDLLREASIDPKVKKIQITVYRVASNSNIVNALINAVKNGKEVVAVMELQARFDEENNIYWANKLQEEGARVIFGVPGIKVHSKLFLITRREEGKLINYAHIGTGNMNESTAKIYTDKSLITADKRITDELVKVFEFYHNNLKPGQYKHLLVSPFTMRRKLEALIQFETDEAKKGRKASMLLKMNNLVDLDMINSLYEASRAGVQITLIIRGTCSLIPGVKGVSENIKAISIVGRYLEHTRVFIFHHGGDEKYFISSADWMTRNLDHRSEVAVPIYDADSQKELKEILELQLRDNRKARLIGGLRENTYIDAPASDKPINAQEAIRDYLGKKTRAPKPSVKKRVEIRRN